MTCGVQVYPHAPKFEGKINYGLEAKKPVTNWVPLFSDAFRLFGGMCCFQTPAEGPSITNGAFGHIEDTADLV